MTSQVDSILRHLKTIGPITPLDALREYGCMRLAARIENLRSMGYSIQTTMIDNGEKKFASYSIKKSSKRAA